MGSVGRRTSSSRRRDLRRGGDGARQYDKQRRRRDYSAQQLVRNLARTIGKAGGGYPLCRHLVGWNRGIIVRPRMGGKWRERGSSLVEFVILMPALFMILFATFEVSRLWLTVGVASEAAREGARVGSLSSPFSNTSAVAT